MPEVVVPPVSTPAAVVPPAVTPPPAATPNWYDGAAAEDIGWIQNKGYKGVADMAQSARNLEKLMGVPQEQIIKLPAKYRNDDGSLLPEYRQALEKLGAPKEAKDYQIDVPKENGDPEMAEMLRKWAFSNGISKSAVEELPKMQIALMEGRMKLAKDNAEVAAKQADAVLKRDWGAAYEQNMNIAKEAARVIGFEQKTVDALHNSLGQAEAMKLFHKLGTQVGEGRFVQGGHTNTIMEPATAKAEIKNLSADTAFGKRLFSGDVEAKTRWDRLHQMAYPGEMQVGR